MFIFSRWKEAELSSTYAAPLFACAKLNIIGLGVVAE